MKHDNPNPGGPSVPRDALSPEARRFAERDPLGPLRALASLCAAVWFVGCSTETSEPTGSGGSSSQGDGGTASGGQNTGGSDAGGSDAGGSDAGGSDAGGGNANDAPHGGETLLPSVLTGYRSLAVNQSHIFFGAEGQTRRVAFDDFSTVDVVFETAVGELAVDDRYLFLGGMGLRRMDLDGSNVTALAASGYLDGRLFLDGGFLYFHRSGKIVRVPTDADGDAEEVFEEVAEGSRLFFVRDGILLTARADGIVRHELAGGAERSVAPPASSPYHVAADAEAAYVLELTPSSASLFAFPPGEEQELVLLEEHSIDFGNFSLLRVSEGRAFYFLPPERRDYYSLFVRHPDGTLQELGNGLIPQPTDLAVAGDFVYVTTLGTSGLAGDPHRLGTLMRFRID